MSVVIKPLEEIQDNTPVQLTELLVIADEMPADFHKNSGQYIEKIKQATEVAESLVFTIDDEGRKKAKENVVLIRKTARSYRGFIQSIYKALTDGANKWKGDFKDPIDAFEAAGDKIMTGFEELEKAKLETIKGLMLEYLAECREKTGIKENHYLVFDPRNMLKLSGSLTEGGQLTKKCKDFVSRHVDDEFRAQIKMEKREFMLKARCLEEGIDPPLTGRHFGTVYYADDEVFMPELEAKIEAEKTRIEAMKEKIRKQQEEENQRKIDSALRDQQETANRNAIAAAQKIQEENKPVETPKIEKRITDPSPIVSAPSRPGRKTLNIAVTFQVSISDTVSNEAFLEHFKAQMPEKMQGALKTIEVSNA